MYQLLLCATLAGHLISADGVPEAGTQWSYRGAVEAIDGETATTEKTFDLTLWILSRDENGAEVFWLVDERGRGGFAWPARFGRATLDARYRTSDMGPALLYDRGDGTSIVPVLLPFFAAEEPLAEGTRWQEDTLEFLVERATKAAGRAAWRVGVRDPFGPKRTLLVDRDGPLVLGLTERVFMGQGDEYRLSLELVESQRLSEERLAALRQAIDAIAALGNKLNLPRQPEQIEWKSEQLASIEKELPRVVERAAGTPLSKLAAEVQRDWKLQTGRNDAVASLEARFDGRQVEDFSVRGTAGESLTAADLQGRITVLHFWDYRDEPLKEPYGQVGYLDFLHHRRKDAGLRLYGVAVDGRLADAERRGAAERSVKKFKAFMNLSYPVLLDSGPLLKQFGDPRVVGASLPLFVAIGPDGKVLHYHVGHYDVHQDQGLKELDQVVQEALQGR